MTHLHTQQCDPCRIGAEKVSMQEAASLLDELPEWEMIDVDGEFHLQRRYTFSNFVEAQRFANAVGELAEEFQHHPALLVEWGSTTVSWWTHKIGGLHHNDFVMAAKTDLLLPH